MFQTAVTTATECMSSNNSHLWKGRTVIALDGSQYMLPHSKDIIQTLDPDAGLQNKGKGHFPRCLVMTAYDVLAEYPVAVEVLPSATSERAIAQKIIPVLPDNAIVLHDKGFPSFKYINYLHNEYKGHYMFRCPSKESFPAVSQFVQSGVKERIISIKPSLSFLAELPAEQRTGAKSINVRAIRFDNKDGNTSVLLTNLIDENTYSHDELVNLYYKRWPVEVHYRNDKCTLEIEKFHSRTTNGIKQEIYCAAIVSIIARLLTHCDSLTTHKHMPQFKNAVICFAMYAAVLVTDNSKVAQFIFSNLLKNIKRVTYTKSLSQRATQPRVCKKPSNKWALKKRLSEMIPLCQR